MSLSIESCRTDQDKISLHIEAEFKQQGVKSASSYTKTVKCDSSFKKRLNSLAVSASVSGSYSGISAGASASYESLTDSVTSTEIFFCFIQTFYKSYERLPPESSSTKDQLQFLKRNLWTQSQVENHCLIQSWACWQMIIWYMSLESRQWETSLIKQYAKKKSKGIKILMILDYIFFNIFSSRCVQNFNQNWKWEVSGQWLRCLPEDLWCEQQLLQDNL